jgi:hypothetical protein
LPHIARKRLRPANGIGGPDTERYNQPLLPSQSCRRKPVFISNRQGIAVQIATSGELAASELIPQEAFRSLG